MISDGNCHLRSEMNEVKLHRTNDHMQLLSLHLDMNNPAKSEQIFQWKQQCFHAAGRLPTGSPFLEPPSTLSWGNHKAVAFAAAAWAAAAYLDLRWRSNGGMLSTSQFYKWLTTMAYSFISTNGVFILVIIWVWNHWLGLTSMHIQSACKGLGGDPFANHDLQPKACSFGKTGKIPIVSSSKKKHHDCIYIYIHMCVSIYVDRYTSSHRIASPGVRFARQAVFFRTGRQIREGFDYSML